MILFFFFFLDRISKLYTLCLVVHTTNFPNDNKKKLGKRLLQQHLLTAVIPAEESKKSRIIGKVNDYYLQPHSRLREPQLASAKGITRTSVSVSERSIGPSVAASKGESPQGKEGSINTLKIPPGTPPLALMI